MKIKIYNETDGRFEFIDATTVKIKRLAWLGEFKFAVHNTLNYRKGKFTLSEVSSGGAVAHGWTKREAISNGRKKLCHVGKVKLLEAIKKAKLTTG